MSIEIRLAQAGCESQLQQVERLSGQRFREIGLAEIADDPPMSEKELAGYISAERCWIAAEAAEIVGYVLVDEVDGNAHVAQISVVPDRQGSGIGRGLLDSAESWAAQRGSAAVTLTTFTDVPWNQPLYEHLGFRVMDEQEIGPELRQLRETEAAHGLDPESRVCMYRDVGH